MKRYQKINIWHCATQRYTLCFSRIKIDQIKMGFTTYPLGIILPLPVILKGYKFNFITIEQFARSNVLNVVFFYSKDF